MSISLIVEGAFAVLLLATLVSCMLLERRLRNLRQDQEGLDKTIRALNGAITAAQTSLVALRGAAGEAGEVLGRQVRMARALTDELPLLISAGERIAGRIENNAPATRPDAGKFTARPRLNLGDDLAAVR